MDPLFEDDSVMDLISDQDLLVAESSSPFEDCVIDGEHISLPIQVCEDAATLVDMLNPQSLSENLTTEEMQHLRSFLPNFDGGSVEESEQERTWNMLFSNQNMCFGNPVVKFANQLESGWFNPEIVRTRKLFLRARRKLVRREQRNYQLNLLPKVIVSRQQLVEAALQLPPGQPVQVPHANNSTRKAAVKSQSLTFDEKVRKRYFEELKAVDCISSEDENYPEGPHPSLSKKQRRHLSIVQGSLGCEFKPILSTFTQINGRGRSSLLVVEQPEDAAGKSSDAKRWSNSGEPVIDVLSRVCGSKNAYEVTEETYRMIMNRHRADRREGKITPELDVSSGSTRLEDIDQRIRQSTGLPAKQQRLSSSHAPSLPPPSFPLLSKANTGDNQDHRSKRTKDADSDSCPSSVDEESEVDLTRKQQVKALPVASTTSSVPTSSSLTTSTTTTAKSKPKNKSLKLKLKLKEETFSKAAESSKSSEETSSIDVNSLLTERVQRSDVMEPLLPPSSPTPFVPAPASPIPPVCLTQDTHSSFFALLREIMLSAEGSSSQKHLLEALTMWNSSPITPLNEWYSQLMALHQRTNGGWPSVIQSALEFLTVQGLVSGPHPDSVYTWEAHGKDSDIFLQDLSLDWFQQQQQRQQLENGHDEKIDVETSNDLNDSLVLSSGADASLNNLNVPGSGLGLGDLTTEETVEQVATTLFEQNDVVLPPRSVTSWLVRPSTAEERTSYQDQERQRYAQPHRAFTFRQHGYEGIVGPVKGVYSPAQGAGTPGTKVRGHNLMVQDRPACVTLLSLVRDAAARLPNGEGTRADICELMKDSQYLAPGAEASLHSVVSGALDRLHYEADPCVKYDSTRKVWIYLHRHRSETEFEQLHKQHQGMPSRVKKPRSEQRQRAAGGGTPVKGSKAANPVTSPPANQVVSVPSSSAAAPVAVEMQSPPAAATSAPTTPAAIQVTAGSRINSNTATLVPGIVKLNSAEVAAIRSQHQEQSRTSTTVVTTVPSVSTATTVSSATSGATIQTFQITTSTGVQTIRVAAPSNLPTALLARTLQLSAQQHSAIAQGQKITVTSASVNGTSTIKQVILSPSSALNKAVPTTLLAHPRPAAVVTAVTSSTTTATPTTTTSLFQLNVPTTSTTALTTAVISPASAATRARLPASPVRLVGRQAVTTATSSVMTGSGTPVQTFLIRPPAPSSTPNPGGPVAAPRLVMVNNKLINLSSTSVVQGANRIIRPGGHVALATTASSLRKPGAVVSTAASIPAGTGARPVLARVVAGPGGANQQQQVITLENLLSLAANPQHNKGGKGTGVVQLPLSAIAGLNVAGGGTVTTNTSSSSSQPTTVLLQNVKGGQSILLPAGFQGGTINIRGVRLATVSGQPNAVGTGQPKQTFVARLVTPQLQQAAAVQPTAATNSTTQPQMAPQTKNTDT